jgi:hypothetical protein
VTLGEEPDPMPLPVVARQSNATDVSKSEGPMEHTEPAMPPQISASFEMTGIAASAMPEITSLPRRETRVRPDDDREFGVSQALKIGGANAGLEVYVGWIARPVGVATRRGVPGLLSWEVAGPLLRERVLAAVQPLQANGWQLDGTFSAAVRWDMSRGAGGDLYEGCWVRMRR